MISERILYLRKIRAGHLGEITKIHKKLERYLKDSKCCSEVHYEKQRLETQWCRYSSVCREMLELLSEDERIEEMSRHESQVKCHEEFLECIEEYLLAVAKQTSEISQRSSDVNNQGSKGERHGEVDDDDRSSISGDSSHSRMSRRSHIPKASSIGREEAKLQRILSFDKSDVSYNQIMTSMQASWDMDDEVRSSVSKTSSRSTRSSRRSSTSKASSRGSEVTENPV